MSEEKIMELVKKVGANFLCFGGGDSNPGNNPIAIALKDRPLMFAAGVDVEQVIRFVLSES